VARYTCHYLSLPYRFATDKATVQWLTNQVLKEGWNYVDEKGKGELGKLRTARGKKTSQILGLRQANVEID